MPTKITKFELSNFVLNELPDFEIEVATVPPNLSTGCVLRQKYDDRSITCPAMKEFGSIWFDVYSKPAQSIPIAAAVFGVGADTVICDTIHVTEAFRRNGIATCVYNLVEDLVDAAVQPSSVQTEDAKKFWENRVKRT